jgi:outer membrane protein OmpA-like peptidoglycan-associated protein
MKGMHSNSGKASLFVRLQGSGFFLIIALAIPALGWQPADQEPLKTYELGKRDKVKGLILARAGDTMKLRTEKGTVIVYLTDETDITSPKGLLKMRTKERNVTHLLPGLRVEVEGAGDSKGRLVADKISFDSDDLKVAQQISAGNAEIQAQTAANRESIEMLNKRMSELDEYSVKYSVVLNFASGSAVLSPEAKSTLDDLVTKGKGTQGYLVEVAGFADTTGSEARNQDLSRRRAESVVIYLEQVRKVPLRRILTPTGMGTSQPTAENTTAAGRAANRRVEVRVLVNKGLQEG